MSYLLLYFFNIYSQSRTKQYAGSILQCEVSGATHKQVTEFSICLDVTPSQVVLPAGSKEITFTFVMSINSDQQQCHYQYDKGVVHYGVKILQ